MSHRTERPPPRTLNRRKLLALAGTGAVGLISAGAVGAEALSRTQERKQAAAAAAATPSPTAAPQFNVLVNEPGTAPGDIFFTNMSEAAAPVITDSAGQIQWTQTQTGAKSYADLRLQSYQGRPVLTWWESHSTGLAAYADGRTVVTDTDHQLVSSIERHAGVSPDEHEFLLTDRGTAYIVSYVKTATDLSKHGGSRKGSVMNGVFEEIDLATGAVLHHWESLDHVALSESYAGVPEKASEPYDYFHINSVKPTPDGNVLISARHTWTVYKVNPTTGEVLWRLGGKKSDFDLPKSAVFAWQHDAQFEDPTTIRLFDNGSDGTKTVTAESQILWFSLDEAKRTAQLVRRLVHPAKVSAIAMGNAQRLDNGNLFVGWGTGARISEFGPDGTLLFDATLPQVSYRAYRQVWR